MENLLERLQVLFARQVIANAVAKPLAPIACVARRTSTPTQFPRHASDRKSLITIEPTHPTASSSSSSSSSLTSNNRKRKRRVESKQLTEVAAPARVKASSDMMCPIRIDVDVNGTRYQDTLLLNAYVWHALVRYVDSAAPGHWLTLLYVSIHLLYLQRVVSAVTGSHRGPNRIGRALLREYEGRHLRVDSPPADHVHVLHRRGHQRTREPPSDLLGPAHRRVSSKLWDIVLVLTFLIARWVGLTIWLSFLLLRSCETNSSGISAASSPTSRHSRARYAVSKRSWLIALIPLMLMLCYSMCD